MGRAGLEPATLGLKVALGTQARRTPPSRIRMSARFPAPIPASACGPSRWIALPFLLPALAALDAIDVATGLGRHCAAPWQCFHLRPELHVHGSLRPRR